MATAHRESERASGASKGKIVLVGASGLIGKHTVRALSRAGGCENLWIVSRTPRSSCASEYCTAGCHVVHGDMNDRDSLKPHFAGASALFIITPGAENRAELVQNALNAAKAASVPFVLVLSVPTANNTRTIYGSQFHAIEAATKACGIPYCLIRLPLYTDNFKAQFETLRTERKWYGAVNPTARGTSVAGCDVGDVSATILRNPDAHHNQTYAINGNSWTRKEAAAIFTRVLGHAIEYEQKPYEAIEKLYVEKGWPSWQVRGMLELFHMTDDGRYEFRETDFKRITGRDPTTLEQWIENHREEILTGERKHHGFGAGGDVVGDKMRMAAGAGGLHGEREAGGRHGAGETRHVVAGVTTGGGASGGKGPLAASGSSAGSASGGDAHRRG